LQQFNFTKRLCKSMTWGACIGNSKLPQLWDALKPGCRVWYWAAPPKVFQPYISSNQLPGHAAPQCESY
jgi:hypothetical protein